MQLHLLAQRHGPQQQAQWFWTGGCTAQPHSLVRAEASARLPVRMLQPWQALLHCLLARGQHSSPMCRRVQCLSHAPFVSNAGSLFQLLAPPEKLDYKVIPTCFKHLLLLPQSSAGTCYRAPVARRIGFFKPCPVSELLSPMAPPNGAQVVYREVVLLLRAVPEPLQQARQGLRAWPLAGQAHARVPCGLGPLAAALGGARPPPAAPQAQHQQGLGQQHLPTAQRAAPADV